MTYQVHIKRKFGIYLTISSPIYNYVIKLKAFYSVKFVSVKLRNLLGITKLRLIGIRLYLKESAFAHSD